jgi:hypothetical protein
MEPEIEFHPEAFKHGVREEDIRHAITTPKRAGSPASAMPSAFQQAYPDAVWRVITPDQCVERDGFL